MPIHHWKQALNHFAILFEDRMPQANQQLTFPARPDTKIITGPTFTPFNDHLWSQFLEAIDGRLCDISLIRVDVSQIGKCDQLLQSVIVNPTVHQRNILQSRQILEVSQPALVMSVKCRFKPRSNGQCFKFSSAAASVRSFLPTSSPSKFVKLRN